MKDHRRNQRESNDVRSGRTNNSYGREGAKENTKHRFVLSNKIFPCGKHVLKQYQNFNIYTKWYLRFYFRSVRKLMITNEKHLK